MKTKEELNILKEEVEVLNQSLAELTEDELAQVNGGSSGDDQGVVAMLLRLVEAGNEEGSVKLFNAYYKYMTAEGAACFFRSFYFCHRYR